MTIILVMNLHIWKSINKEEDNILDIYCSTLTKINMEKSVFDRLLTEYKELETKTTKLRDFLINKIDKTSIDNLNKDLLIAQLKAMEAYLTILSIRIGLNQPTQEEKQLDVAKSTINE